MSYNFSFLELLSTVLFIDVIIAFVLISISLYERFFQNFVDTPLWLLSLEFSFIYYMMAFLVLGCLLQEKLKND
jgi:hypothetical protein